MKKAILIIAGLCLVITGHAQKQNIQSALNYLRDKDYDRAKDFIDKAVIDPSTATDAKAWSVRGDVYIAMQDDPKYATSSPYKEAATSYIKAAELDPGYEKENMPIKLEHCAYSFFNNGINAYNDRKYEDAADLMSNTIKIHNVNGGKEFDKEKYKGFDTVAAVATYIKGNSYYALGKYDDALPLLTEAKNSGKVNSADIYLHIALIYKTQGKDADWIATLQEGRKALPNDASIRNEELNYYIKTGKQGELAKKLEDAVAKEPNNAALLYNLATTYNDMANAKDKPANYDELNSKAEDAYLKAIKIDPDNSGYNYNLGALYFNEAEDVTGDMNAITGTSAAETKKYNDLKVKRDGLFDKALPYVEKAYTALDAKSSSLKGEDRDTYHGTLIALKKIYATQSKMDKLAEINKKMEAFH